MFSKELFGARLKETRQKHKETQEMLGDVLGIAKSRISEMESGINTTTAERIAMICEHYKISSDYLLGLTDNPSSRY